MAVQEMKPGVYSIGVNDWDRRVFDELIPLPDGTSYNSYLVKGSEKIAVIDSVDPPKSNLWLDNIEKMGIEKVDYIISNHAEQDHSGSIPDLLARFPEATVITNEKCKGFLIDLLRIPADRFITVKDRETLSLGDRTLEFVFTPWVHWPETMSTYLQEEKILFSCDFFGSHLATSNLFVKNPAKVVEDAKRYFAEIMMPFRTIICKNIQKIEELAIDYIAPSHGPVYDDPSLIIDAYKDWISDRLENKVLLAYVSMHGSTEKMAQYLCDALIDRGIHVHFFNLTQTDLGQLAMEMVDSATLVLGTSTVLAGPHPAAVYAATLVNALKPRLKYAAFFGSYGWAGRTVEILKANLGNIRAELLEPILTKGDPGEEDYARLDKLADEIAERHKKLMPDAC
jgi:flavorubredoxin